MARLVIPLAFVLGGDSPPPPPPGAPTLPVDHVRIALSRICAQFRSLPVGAK